MIPVHESQVKRQHARLTDVGESFLVLSNAATETRGSGKFTFKPYEHPSALGQATWASWRELEAGSGGGISLSAKKTEEEQLVHAGTGSLHKVGQVARGSADQLSCSWIAASGRWRGGSKFGLCLLSSLHQGGSPASSSSSGGNRVNVYAMF